MSLLIRAIINGFGFKLGGDIYRLINGKLGIFPEEDAAADDDGDEAKGRVLTILGGM